MEPLQETADHVAQRLGRAVYIEDAVFRPLAASAQVGHIDEARVQALLYRGPSEEHLRYFVERGVPQARRPLRIPTSEEHELLARVMIPVVDRGRVLARIWLIDSRPRLEDADIAWASERGEELSGHLADRDERNLRAAAIGERLVRGIVHAGRNRREGLVGQLCDQYGLADVRGTFACVVRPVAGEAQGGRVPRERMDEMLITVLEPLDAHRAAGYALEGELRLLLSPRSPGESAAEGLASASRRAAAVHGVPRMTAGIGGALGTGLGLERSFSEALFAERVAAGEGEPVSVASWDELGERRLFFGVDWSIAGVATLHRGVAAMLDRPLLAETLLAYLEREGDVDETAKALNVHRTTLYYRIGRARDALGEEPVGRGRFAIHAALRLAELAGLCGGVSAARPGAPQPAPGASRAMAR